MTTQLDQAAQTLHDKNKDTGVCKLYTMSSYIKIHIKHTVHISIYIQDIVKTTKPRHSNLISKTTFQRNDVFFFPEGKQRVPKRQGKAPKVEAATQPGKLGGLGGGHGQQKVNRRIIAA